MVDVMDPQKRSALMSRIRARDTAPELCVRHYLWRGGFRYQLYRRDLPGRPDLVLPKWRKVIFVHGCFWHRHMGCPYFRLPRTRTRFWDEKLRRNQRRDLAAVEDLTRDGWKVAVVWECAIRLDPSKTARKLAMWIAHGKSNLELDARTRVILASAKTLSSGRDGARVTGSSRKRI